MSSSKIPFELLKGRENFDTWEIGVKAYLTIKELWVWTTKKPDATKPTEVTSDARAKGELTLLIDPTLYSYIANAVTTKDAWDGIVAAFQDNGTCQKIFTLVKFVTTKSEDFSTRQEYVNAMLTLWRKVQTAGFSIDEKTAGSLMLGRLPAEYRPMILGIENSGSTITVDFAKNLILQDTLLTREGGENESALKCFAKSKDKKKKVQCYNCKGDHYRNKCPLLKKNNTKENDKVLFSAFIANKRSDDWFIDSAATAHMTHERDNVQRLEKSHKDYVLAADGNKMKIVGTGNVKKVMTTNRELTIEKVQVVPNICANLLSVSQIVLKNYEVIFNKKGCKIINEKNEIVATGRLEDNMFKLNTITEFACTVTKSESIKLWHRRLGHVSLVNLKFLNLNVPSGLKCKVCMKGKQCRKPFTNMGTRAVNKLEIVHSDVCGPIQIQSMSGCKYFVTFIDDFTRKVFVYVLKNKNQVFKCFVDFKNLTENQTGCKIKTIRSDNGTEYVNKEFETFCGKNGILHQRSAPYTPQQNGLAERMNRTLLDRVRCMLLDSKLPRKF